MGRKHNAFNPESQSDNIDTKYAVDRMRITQVKIWKYIQTFHRTKPKPIFQPEELAPGLRNYMSGFKSRGVRYTCQDHGQNSYINFDTASWGASGVRVEK